MNSNQCFSTSCQRTNIYKGPRISAELSLAGRFIVLFRFLTVFLFLKNRRQKTIKKLVQSIKPKGFGVIVRTVAEGKNRIRKDLQNLLSRWTAMCKITNRSSSVKIGELNRASILRDVLMILSVVFKLMMKSCTTKQRIICKKLHHQTINC
jgi:ribonuclease G